MLPVLSNKLPRIESLSIFSNLLPAIIIIIIPRVVQLFVCPGSMPRKNTLLCDKNVFTPVVALWQASIAIAFFRQAIPFSKK